ncbi:hypothetical protein VP01_1055g2 [Puccinia sorghi]|uniref:Uncharacterized protein n=1 Tax=Puccinia sorghi TaxID=27349 RepID=A0A0L6VU14_9BASI|nr:hypothetical protein VP01_1055g2 [Puccinia sorghi]
MDCPASPNPSFWLKYFNALRQVQPKSLNLVYINLYLLFFITYKHYPSFHSITTLRKRENYNYKEGHKTENKTRSVDSRKSQVILMKRNSDEMELRRKDDQRLENVLKSLNQPIRFNSMRSEIDKFQHINLINTLYKSFIGPLLFHLPNSKPFSIHNISSLGPVFNPGLDNLLPNFTSDYSLLIITPPQNPYLTTPTSFQFTISPMNSTTPFLSKDNPLLNNSFFLIHPSYHLIKLSNTRLGGFFIDMKKVPEIFYLMHSHFEECTVTGPKHLHMQTGGVWMTAWLEHTASLNLYGVKITRGPFLALAWQVKSQSCSHRLGWKCIECWLYEACMYDLKRMGSVLEVFAVFF